VRAVTTADRLPDCCPTVVLGPCCGRITIWVVVSRLLEDAIWPKCLSPERGCLGTVRGTRHPPTGQSPEKGRYRVNTQFAVLRLAFGAAAAVALFVIVHSVLQAFSTTASVLGGS
jgi:hypothetical protein